MIDIAADVNEVDETGCVWTFLSEASDPTRIVVGALIMAGDEDEPFGARVVDLVEGPGDETVVHLDVVGLPDVPSAAEHLATERARRSETLVETSDRRRDGRAP